MPVPRVKSITVEGHTSIRSARVELGDLNVLVGANGAGKSNFIRALELLGRIVDERLQLYVEINGGASLLMHGRGADPMRLVLDAPRNRYEAALTATRDDRLVFADERFTYQGSGYEQPWTSSSASGHRETRLHEIVRERGKPSVASYVVDWLRGCRVYHFHDTSRTAPVKQPSPTADNMTLQAEAGNLAAVLHNIRERDNAAFRRIVGAVGQVAPFFRGFVLEPEVTDRIRLRWQQTDSDTVFSAHQMSDGTLRFICLATLLLQPDLPGLIVLDEPELGLHPYAIAQLGEMLRAAAVSRQVVIATQSVTLMDQFSLEDLIVVEREGGASTFDRPEPGRLREWLDEYSLGELWQKNLIGGRPQRED